MSFKVGDEIIIILPYNSYWGLELFNNSVQIIYMAEKYTYLFKDSRDVLWHVPAECAFPATELMKALL